MLLSYKVSETKVPKIKVCKIKKKNMQQHEFL